MKKLILVIGATLISMSASADTINQSIAKDMAVILRSAKVQSMLDQGIGHFQAIEYSGEGYDSSNNFYSTYNVQYTSCSGTIQQMCSIGVQVYSKTRRLKVSDKPYCRDIEIKYWDGSKPARC
jgi:hypothetical protein